ncbi:MAG: beta-ketoacyl-[acyl-carrier-protein] synthase family protein [Endomicrobiales bacterium]|nr:beta-ketoacyl-[acyl-carrier-protein] synthase family protein [Endomicrobiales bacterium]
MDNRVVVTGLGVVSSIGIGTDVFWQNLIAGKSGINKVSMFDTSKYNRHFAGEIRDFDPSRFMPKKLSKHFGRASQFAIAATKMALDDAEFGDNRKHRTAVIIGTTLPEDSEIDYSSRNAIEKRYKGLETKSILNVLPISIVRNVGYYFGVKGMSLLVPNACGAGNFALGYGYDLIKKGEIETAIVGGTESLSRIGFQGFQRLYAMAPEKCAPFDKNRKGMLLGEGAGILILESAEHAERRNAKMYCEISGYGMSSDAYNMTIPKREGVAKAMKKALEDSGLSGADIDYISAHGTGTVANDKNESQAIIDVFGEHGKKVPVSSIKSMIGHTMGAASAIEAISCCLAMRDGVIPPTVNFETPDPECGIDCVPNSARKQEVDAAINNGFAFGGNNCCVVLQAI